MPSFLSGSEIMVCDSDSSDNNDVKIEIGGDSSSNFQLGLFEVRKFFSIE